MSEASLYDLKGTLRAEPLLLPVGVVWASQESRRFEKDLKFGIQGWQSIFHGWHIECQKPTFASTNTAAIKMDFFRS